MRRVTNFVFAMCLFIGSGLIPCSVLAVDENDLSKIFHITLEASAGCVCPVYECPPGSGMYYATNCADGKPTSMVAKPGLPAGSCTAGCVSGSSCQPATFILGNVRIAAFAIPGLNLRPNREFVPEAPNGEKILGSFIVDFQQAADSNAITAKLFLVKVPGPPGMEPLVIGYGVEIQRDSQRPDLTLIGANHVTHVMDHLYQVKVNDASFMVFTHITTP